MLEREEQSPLVVCTQAPKFWSPHVGNPLSTIELQARFGILPNAPVILDATFVLCNSVTLTVSRLCGRDYAIGSLERVLDGLAFCDRDQARLPIHPHHRVE